MAYAGSIACRNSGNSSRSDRRRWDWIDFRVAAAVGVAMDALMER